MKKIRERNLARLMKDALDAFVEAQEYTLSTALDGQGIRELRSATDRLIGLNVDFNGLFALVTRLDHCFQHSSNINAAKKGMLLRVRFGW